MAEQQLEFNGVTFSYPGGPPVIRDFSFELARGEFCCVLGPSGSGKTTLLYLAAGIRQPDSGTVTVAGRPVQGPSKRVGLMLQDYGLLPWFTARRNIEVGLAISGADRSRQREQAEAWLAKLGLADIATSYPAQLSGGQRQRVALARQFALGNELLLLDEPLSAVDELSRERLQRSLFELTRESGGTTMMVTHSVEEAALLSGTILLISEQAPITRAEVLKTPFPDRIPERSEAAFQQFCALIREKLRL